MAFFAIMVPLFLLSKIDRFSLLAHAIVPCCCGFINAAGTLIVELLQAYPLAMLLAVGMMMLFNCLMMMHPKTYLFGFASLFISSIVLSFASYDFFDIEEFNVNLWVITTLNIGVGALAHWLFPDSEGSAASAPPPKPSRTDVDYIAQIAMGWLVAMTAFVVFQIADLYDSLSVLASVIILLTPMTLAGSVGAAKVRIIGTGLGCVAGAAVQLLLGHWFANGLLFWLAVTIAMGPLCHFQTQGLIKAAIGFSAMSALTVPLTTTLVPEQQDAFFSILYRFSSIFVAVAVTLKLIWLVHHWLRVYLARHERKQLRHTTS